VPGTGTCDGGWGTGTGYLGVSVAGADGLVIACRTGGSAGGGEEKGEEGERKDWVGRGRLLGLIVVDVEGLGSWVLLYCIVGVVEYSGRVCYFQRDRFERCDCTVR
jgi:hypothetical protein